MAERRAKGVCLLCGEGGHWIRACKLYEERVGKHAGAAPPSKVWCLRHGNEEHSTARCSLKSPPINFPDEAAKAGLTNTCLWCGIKGHDLDDCIRRCPARITETDTKVTGLESELILMRKAVDGMESMQLDIKTIKSDIVELKGWRQQVDVTVASLQTRSSKFDDFLNNQWPQTSQTVSKFQQFLEQQQQQQPPGTRGNELPVPGEDDDRMTTGMTGSKRQQPDGLDDPEDSEGTPVSTRAKKRLTENPWLAAAPLKDGNKEWTDQLCRLLLPEWSESKELRLTKWLDHHKKEEMAETVRALPEDLHENKPARDEALKEVLRRAGTPPGIFKEVA